jgi:3-hydroxyacyl-CoA dehydrogenase
MKKAGYPAAKWVQEMLDSGIETFYQYKDGTMVGVYDVTKQKYVKFKKIPGMVSLGLLRGPKHVIKQNTGATLFDIGDGVQLLEFHTKMNSLDEDIFNMMDDALNGLDDYEGLVIGNEGEHFSAGANLGLILMGAKMGAWDTLDQAMMKMQGLSMRMRYSPKPVVIAPAGLALGGGAEFTMHASRVVTGAELYIGLVELGMGLIPAGGGTKEMMRRIINPAMKTENAEAFPFVQRAFLQIGQAKVATSAEEARGMGILGPQDRIVMHRDHLLTEAKKEVLHMAATGYRPPAPELIYAPGQDMYGAMKIGAWQFKEGGYITEYDSHVATKLAYVMAGGCLSRPQWVSEQYILDLEREAFLSLCGEEKTQDRIYSFLQTGRPLRN